MENELNLTAVFVAAEEGGFTAYIEEIRGVVSEGETIEEAQENLMDALQLVLEKHWYSLFLLIFFLSNL